MDPNLLNLINLIYLVTFVVLVFLAIGKIVVRYFTYRNEKKEIPLLLKRDFFFLSGLSLPFIGIFIFRVTGVIPQQEPWAISWTLGSGALALLATLYWVYIEYFKIEH